MLVVLFWTCLIASVHTASESVRHRISPETYSITTEDTIIYVDGMASDGTTGTYTKLIPPQKSVERSFFQKMEEECGKQWSMIGQWKRAQGTTRYLLVFNHKSQDPSIPPRWIIASFQSKNTGRGAMEVDPLTVLDTANARYSHAFVYFFIPGDELKLHAKSSAVNSMTVESQDTQQRQEDDVGLAQSEEIALITRLLNSANSEILQLRGTIEEQRKSQSIIAKENERLKETIISIEADRNKLAGDLHSQITAFQEERERFQKTSREQLIQIESLNGVKEHLRGEINEQHQCHLDIAEGHIQQIQSLQAKLEESKVALRLQQDEAEKENAQLKSQLFWMQNKEANDPPQQPNAVIWCCISAVVATMVVLLIGCIYHRRRLRKEQKESMRLYRVISINKNNRETDVIIDTCPGKKTMFSEGKKDQEPNSLQIMGRNVTDPKCGESFNDLVQNMDEVQGVMMDDIMDQMVTEGAEESGKDERHIDEDGAHEGHVVTGAPSHY